MRIVVFRRVIRTLSRPHAPPDQTYGYSARHLHFPFSSLNVTGEKYSGHTSDQHHPSIVRDSVCFRSVGPDCRCSDPQATECRRSRTGLTAVMYPAVCPERQPCPLLSSHSVLMSDPLRQGQELVLRRPSCWWICVRGSASVWMAVCCPHLHLDGQDCEKLAKHGTSSGAATESRSCAREGHLASEGPAGAGGE